MFQEVAMIGIDATGSREPTWDIAAGLMSSSFAASRWVSDARTLAGLMEKIDCRTGFTQIGKILSHARKENTRQKVAAMVFVGDCVEEQPAELYAAARELGVPAFLFQEGDDPVATKVLREIARLTRGAHVRFEQGSAKQLSELLRAVAAYAAGGLKALSTSNNAGAVKLLQQL
jgi:hypothetical protein